MLTLWGRMGHYGVFCCTCWKNSIQVAGKLSLTFTCVCPTATSLTTPSWGFSLPPCLCGIPGDLSERFHGNSHFFPNCLGRVAWAWADLLCVPAGWLWLNSWDDSFIEGHSEPPNVGEVLVSVTRVSSNICHWTKALKCCLRPAPALLWPPGHSILLEEVEWEQLWWKNFDAGLWVT